MDITKNRRAIIMLKNKEILSELDRLGNMDGEEQTKFARSLIVKYNNMNKAQYIWHILERLDKGNKLNKMQMKDILNGDGL